MDLEELRERVRSDRRTVTAPLMVFGVLVLVHFGLVLLAGAAGAPVRHSLALVYWPVAGAVGLFVLWRHAHRVAERTGVGEGPRSYRPIAIGYLVSLPLLALLFIPAFFAGIWAPLVWPAAILAAVGVRQRNTTLKKVAKWLAFLGAVQLLLVLVAAAVGDAAVWAAIGLGPLAGLALVGAAVVRTRRAPRAVHA
ncbi:hypothetical protein [Cryptosporangium sp. NPDC051539]|uniref:hypothetical protein n=1 Tax=Cryptosporangium sp. NPDC051539 TaxID=3363962 RepID=UPI0037A37CBB